MWHKLKAGSIPSHPAPTGEALEAEGVFVRRQQAVGAGRGGAALGAALQDQRLGQQHAGHRDEGDEQQEDLQRRLPRKHLVLGALAAAVDVAGLQHSHERAAGEGERDGTGGAATVEKEQGPPLP